MVTLIQIIIVLFALFAWSRAFLRFREGKLTRNELIFWSIGWLLVIIIVLLPGTTNILARTFGVGRGADVVVYISIIVLFYLIFKLYVKLDSLEKDITKIVREIALERKKKK